jgi:hypothetical protein
MVGVYMSVWVRAGLLPHIRGVQATSVGTGIMGYLGNKGMAADTSPKLCRWNIVAMEVVVSQTNCLQRLCCHPASASVGILSCRLHLCYLQVLWQRGCGCMTRALLLWWRTCRPARQTATSCGVTTTTRRSCAAPRSHPTQLFWTQRRWTGSYSRRVSRRQVVMTLHGPQGGRLAEKRCPDAHGGQLKVVGGFCQVQAQGFGTAV